MIVAVAVCGFRLFPRTDVTVLSNGTTYQVSATFDARHEALQAADISLQPGDVVRFAGGDRYASLAIQHAQPVRIEADGVITEVRTQATTIEGALAEAGVSLQPDDRVYLDDHLATARGPLSASVAASSHVFVPSSDARTGTTENRTIAVEVVRARPVTFIVDELPVYVRSSAPTVQAFLSDMGMTVREGDLVQPALDTELSAGMTIRLANARTVNVTIDGKPQTMYTQARTVADIFHILGITIGPEDVLSLPADTAVEDGLSISLGRTIVTDEDVLEPIEPGTSYETDPTLPAGQSRTVAGVAGQKKTTYRITYKSGVEQSRVAIGESEVTLAPVATRIIQGTKGNVAKPPVTVSNPAPAATPAPVVVAPTVETAASGRKLTVVATWYNESHGAWARDDPNYGLTASGVRLRKGICAVDPTVIPLGTQMYVPGYGYCVAGDTGGGVKGNHIDLAFPEADGTPDWGVRTVEITIYN